MSTRKSPWFWRALISFATIAVLLGGLAPVSSARSPASFSTARVYLPLIMHDSRSLDNLSEEERNLWYQQQEFLREHSDRSGNVRPDLWQKGIAQAKRMRIAAGLPRLQSGAPPNTIAPASGGLIGVQWTQIGPAPLIINAEQNFQGAGPNSGQVVDIALDPRNTTDQTIYIATNDGGIWKSTDGGASWKPKTDSMPSLSTGAVALDPGNPSIVYAGTGNPHDGAGLFTKGIGIYKSIDAGETWSIVGAGLFTNKQINRIALPAPDVLLIATSSGLYRSRDGGLNFGANAPNFNDGQPILGSGSLISDLAIDTTTSTTIYAAVSGQGLFRSTDSGATFPTNLFSNTGAPSGSYGDISFTQSTQPNNQRMYVNIKMPPCNKDSNGNLLPSQTCGQVYRSDNTGGSWTLMTDATNRATENRGCQCGYDLTVGVDPQDQNRVYIGYQELYVSTNGGTNFGTPATTRNDVHWDHHALRFSPRAHWGSGGAPTRIYVGTDGGIAQSGDGGANWSNINQGIATNLFRAIDIGRGSSANNAFTYGGTQDTGTVEHRPPFTGTEWHLGIDGDGGRVAVDPTNPMRVYGVDNGGYKITTDGGATWTTPSGTNLPLVFLLAVDANSSNIVYATSATNGGFTAGNQLWRSTDTGSTFTLVNTFPSTIQALAPVPIDSNRLWVGLTNGALQYTTNASAGSGANWTSVTIAGTPGSVGGIAIDPSNPNQVLAVYTGFSGITAPNRTQHVFRTADNGANWNDISGTDGGDPTQNLPDLPFHSVVIDPGTTPHTIIAANDAGVMRSVDLGASWQVLGVGMPAVYGSSLAIDTRVTPPLLRVGTYGRSAFELTTATGPLLAINADLAFGTVALGSSATRIVQLFNVGSADLHISSFTRLAGSADFQIISGPATPVTLPPGEEIDYTIRFQPSAAGNRTATFQVNSDDPFKPALQLPASGAGGTPRIVVGGDLNFGTVARGAAATRDITVYNTGSAPLVVSSVTFDAGSDPSFSVVGPATPQTIAPGSHLAFTIRFAPPANATPGARTGTLRINSNDPINPSVTVPASGIVGTPRLTLSSNALLFGQIAVDDRTSPNSSDQALRISNQASCAGCDVTLLSLPISGPAAGDFSVVSPPAFPVTIGAGSQLELTIRFNPSGSGDRDAMVTVNSDDPGGPSVPVSLHGVGLVPAISAAPAALIFGPTVYDPICSGLCGQTLNATIVDSGQVELILDKLLFSGSPVFSGSGAAIPPTRVQPGSSFVDSVLFHPTGGPARKVTGVLHVEDTLGPAPSAPPVMKDIPLCGESVGRGIRVLVYDTNGTLVPTVGRLTLQSHSLTSPINIQAKNLPLTTIDPPASCQRIQFQYENQQLPATDLAGQRGSYYILNIDVGNKHTTVSFTLAVNEFKTIIATVQ